MSIFLRFRVREMRYRPRKSNWASKNSHKDSKNDYLKGYILGKGIFYLQVKSVKLGLLLASSFSRRLHLLKVLALFLAKLSCPHSSFSILPNNQIQEDDFESLITGPAYIPTLIS